MEAPCEGCDITCRRMVLMCEDPEAIRDFLIAHGVLSATFDCESCGSPARLRWEARAYRCQRTYRTEDGRRRKCNFYRSCFTDTFFAQCRLPIDKAMILIVYWLTLPPPRHHFLNRELDVSERTVVRWQVRLREVAKDWVLARSARGQIGGVGEVVEVDESKVGKRQGKRGRPIKGQWIFGGVLRSDPRQMFAVPVESRGSNVLYPIIRDRIVMGTTIMSDMWKAYDCLESKGYPHLKVNHSKRFVDTLVGCHTQNIERMWREVKCHVPRFGRKKHHYFGYLAEFSFKRAYPAPMGRVHEFFKYLAECGDRCRVDDGPAGDAGGGADGEYDDEEEDESEWDWDESEDDDDEDESEPAAVPKGSYYHDPDYNPMRH